MKLSFILPTYNNEKTLQECLESIFMQKFEDFEVLIIDGGSSDRTLEIAKKYNARIIKNPDKNEEVGRMLGIKKAKGEIIAFIDADNILVGNGWIERMLFPFKDKEIVFADTLYYEYRKRDKIRVRYQALIGGDDPLAMYLGLYSRYSYITNDWTSYPYKKENKKGYIKARLEDKNRIPAMGSNGFLVRKKILKKFVKNSFIHSDIVYEMVNNNYNCFAKVNTSIVHNQPKFFPNKIRRIKRRLNNEVKIKYDYGLKKEDLIKIIVYLCLIFPIAYDTIKGFIRKPSLAWLFHPIACYGELFLHFYYNLKFKIKNRA